MSVQCGQIRRYQKWPDVPDPDTWVRINVCSSNPGEFGKLSPFRVKGPTIDGIDIQNIENMWQQSKVYPEEVDSVTGQPTEAFFRRRNEVWASPKALRHVMLGKTSMRGKRFAYVYWDGQHYDYVKGRQEIYVKHYVRQVTRLKAWADLKKLHDQGKNILILGYDGRAFQDLDQEWNRPNLPFGHELVLCAMLLGRIDLETGEWV